MPRVNPEIMRWARVTAGLTEDDAAAKLDIHDSRGVAGAERLRALEEGSEQPSRPLLVRMAKQYRRPLLAFYLTRPPARGDRGQDFRTLPGDEPPEDEPILDALIRDLKARQSLLRSALLDVEEVERLRFIGSITLETGVQATVSAIRRTLGYELQDYRAARDVDGAFASLREHAEAAGVFVLLLGNLGSHHTNIDPETFRGFALADEFVPFLVINDQDHHAAWSFTLLHEFTHLLLGQTGVSGGRPEQTIEKFCNEVASEFLLPTGELQELTALRGLTVEACAERISEFALRRNVSHSMVAYRLYSSQYISRQRWSELSGYFREHWLAERERRRVHARETDGGPNYYVVKRHRLGTALVETTARLTAAGALTTSKAGAVLGVKPKNVQALISEYRPRAS